MSAIQAQIAADAVQQEYDRIAEIEDEQRRAYELGEFEDFSVFRDLLPFLPVNLKQYAYDLMGGDKPFSVNDLTDQELELLQKLVLPLIPEDAKPGDVIDVPYETWQTTEPGKTYEDVATPKRGQVGLGESGERKLYADLSEERKELYNQEAEKKYPGVTTPTDKNMLQLMQDPKFRLKTLLGHAQIMINEQGQPVLVDRFNYNEEDIARETEARAMGSVEERPLYNIPRIIGGVMGSDPGEGSQIEIVIPPELAEGGPTDRITEIEEESKGTLMGDIILSMFPSTEKSTWENIFDIATLAVPPAKALKLGKLAKMADPIADTGIMQMARMPKAMKDKLKQYGTGVSKPGFTKVRGGGKDITLKTRSPEVWETYRKVASFSRGGSQPKNLTPETVEQLRKIMPQLRAAAKNEARHGRTTMKNVVKMFDDNFYVPRGRPRAFDFSRIRANEVSGQTRLPSGVRKFDILDANGKSMGTATSKQTSYVQPTPDTSVPIWETVITPKNKQAAEHLKNMNIVGGKWDSKTKTFRKLGVGLEQQEHGSLFADLSYVKSKYGK